VTASNSGPGRPAGVGTVVSGAAGISGTESSRYLGLAGLADAVRTGRISAVELVRVSLTRIDEARDLNAVVRVRVDEALAEAAEIDRATRRGVSLGPLAGVPLLVKDIEDVAGLPTTFGSLLHRDAPPALVDGLVPRRLRAAGAIVVGKTNVPEFAFEGYTFNRLFGATVNPWAADRSPGGSSGGSASAMAAGLAPIATATDGGGSIRIPAAACGLVGIKPTNGVVGREPIPWWIDLSTDGPLATTVADLRLLLELEAGPTDGDPTAQVGWHLGPDRRPGRILAAERFAPFGPLPADTARLFEGALGDLESILGGPIVRLEPDKTFRSGNIDEDWFRIAAAETVGALGRERMEVALRDELLEPGFGRWMADALAIGIDEYLGARRRRFDYVRELDELLGEDRVIVTPTLTVEGWTPDGVVPGRESEGPGLPLDVFNTSAQNMTGHPAISLPAGRFPEDGLPFGLQVTAPRYREDLLFGFATAWEAARPWPLVADGYEVFGPDA
jgi:Asp-tRNA(Asn)/Glu-tRNA(Gln) amidotransferase A subunit family amidase